MKRSLVSILLVVGIASCAKQPKGEGTLFVVRDSLYSFVLPPGDSASYRFRDESHVDIRLRNGDVVTASIEEIRSRWDSTQASKHDSLDLFRGSAIEHAYWGPPLANVDGEDKIVDSVIKLDNVSGLAFLDIKCTYVSYGGVGDSSALPYEVFFVDVTKGKPIRMVEILVYQHLPEVADECRKICQSIRLVTNAK